MLPRLQRSQRPSSALCTPSATCRLHYAGNKAAHGAQWLAGGIGCLLLGKKSGYRPGPLWRCRVRPSAPGTRLIRPQHYRPLPTHTITISSVESRPIRRPASPWPHLARIAATRARALSAAPASTSCGEHPRHHTYIHVRRQLWNPTWPLPSTCCMRKPFAPVNMQPPNISVTCLVCS